jgi:hypothetical protein
MKWIARSAAAAGILGIAAFGGLACSDSGGELSLEEYFKELEALDQRFEEEGTEAEESFESDDLDTIKEGFEASVGVVEDFVNDLDDLDPPSEAEAAHESAVEAGNDLLAEFEVANDALQDAASEADLLGIFTGEAFGDASERFTAACVELQGIADENDIDVALNCG